MLFISYSACKAGKEVVNNPDAGKDPQLEAAIKAVSR